MRPSVEKKRPLGPMVEPEDEEKASEKETPSECDVLEAKKVGGMTTVETKSSTVDLGSSRVAYSAYELEFPPTLMSYMNPRPSRHQWPYENFMRPQESSL